MSSLHHDRLLDEGAGPTTGTASPLASTRRTTSRRSTGSAEEKATHKVPSQRQGAARRSGTSQTTGTATAAARPTRTTKTKAATGTPAGRASAAKSATTKPAAEKVAATKAAAAKAATAKAASTKAASTKPATTPATTPATEKVATEKVAATRAATAKASATRAASAKSATATSGVKAAAGTRIVTRTAAKAAPAAKTTGAAKAATAATAATPAAAAKTATTATPAATATKPATGRGKHRAPKGAKTTGLPAALRPTPYKRSAVAPEPAIIAVPVAGTGVVEEPVAEELRTVVAAPASGTAARPPAGVVELEAGTRGRLPQFMRHQPPVGRRRAAVYLAAALVSGLSVSAFAADPQAAQAETMSNSVSVAQELGIQAQVTEDLSAADAGERLGALAASRSERDADQAAAAQAQADADAAAAAAAAEAARPKAVAPVQGARLTSTFGPRWGSMHAGIDLAAPMRTPEYSVMDGVVLEAGPASGYGLAVYIQHENGDVTVYGHMDEILVSAGQVVKAGDTIALLGNRGQSTGPHLHFEVHVGGVNGQKIDPLPWLAERGITLG